MNPAAGERSRTPRAGSMRPTAMAENEMSLRDAGKSLRPLREGLRAAVLLIVAAELIFWGYTVYFIDRQGNLRGDGLEVVAMIPMTAIAAFVALPALLLTISGRALWLALGLALLAGAANIAIWPEIVREIARATLPAS